jgi:hypothetical protein
MTDETMLEDIAYPRRRRTPRLAPFLRDSSAQSAVR